MNANTVRIRSLGELIDHVTPDEPDPVTGRRRDSGVYRGVGDSRWPMLTSLDRLGGVDPPHTKCGLEEHVLRNFVRYSRPYVSSDMRNDWELLATAQHHGVPTRLLDWSYSPFVAAHFATLGRRDAEGEGRPDRAADRAARDHGGDPPAGDAAQGEEPASRGTARVIWRLDWQRVHEAFGFTPLALLADDLTTLRGQADFTPWALITRDRDLPPFACLFEPPTLDARIAAQSAVFTLCSDTTRAFDRFLADHGLTDVLTRFVIAAEDVARVRDQLDLVTIDERRLFPDLDGVATRLRRYYS
ncbi:MAG TPA: FRG domain-containing protein [Gemmatirosa sp.]